MEEGYLRHLMITKVMLIHLAVNDIEKKHNSYRNFTECNSLTLILNLSL